MRLNSEISALCVNLEFLQGTKNLSRGTPRLLNLFFILQIYSSTLKGTDTTSASILLNFEDEALGEDYFYYRVNTQDSILVRATAVLFCRGVSDRAK
jgi:hypothetical protein